MHPHAACPQVWGNWEHLACRGARVTYTKEQVGAEEEAASGRTAQARRPPVSCCQPC